MIDMAKAVKTGKALMTAKGRGRLDVRPKPYFTSTAMPGVSIGYRKLKNRAGTWSVRIADGEGGNRVEMIGVADDLEAANGLDVLSFEQASEKAREVARDPFVVSPLTVSGALDKYETELLARGGLPGNVSRVRAHLPSALAGKPLQELSADDLKAWRDGIKAAPATVNRTIRILRTALGQADEARDSIWKKGLKQKPHAHEARNVVLTDDQVRDVVQAAYALDPAFGLYVDVHAVTGARPSQIARLEVRDLQVERGRVMMPTSRKGTGNKARNIAVPITAALGAALQVSAAGRSASAPLLLRSKGDAWNPAGNDHRDLFAKAVEDAGLDPKEVTIYALRHSSIVRRIRANRTPLRTIAAIHDTSVVMIERNYSRDIDQYDESAREGLLDTGVPLADNVLAFAR